MMNSTANIHKRFTLLFTLPSKLISIILLFATSLMMYLAIFNLNLKSNFFLELNFQLYLVSFFLVVLIEQNILKNPLAIFRRLAFISIVSNLLWLSIVTIGSLLLFEKVINYIILGAFISLTFRFLIFSSVFIKRLSLSLIMAAFQPIVIILMILFNFEPLLISILENPFLIIIGIIPVIGMTFFLMQVSSSSYNILEKPTLHVFQAFLKAWSSDDPNALEEIIDEWSSREKVNTNILYFHNDKSKSVIIIPEVHPGPFYPIGSSNLPFRIFKYFSERSFSSIILHGLSGHELNLSSKEQVDNLLKSYNNLNYFIEGNKCSEPISYKLGKTLINGIAFGKCAIIYITLSPNGMEDLPREIKNPLELESQKNGFKNLIIVDSHNSQGNRIVQEDSVEVIEVGKKVLQKLGSLKQYPFKIGFSHSSEINTNLEKDIGPAGIGIIVTEVNNQKFSLIAVDSNNAIKNLREKIINNLMDESINVIDICTSDTHITAGKIMSSHGYIALGDITSINDLVNIIKKLYEKASNNLEKSKYSVAKVATDLKIIGDNMLKKISISLDKTLKTVKRGMIYILIVFLAVIILYSIL